MSITVAIFTTLSLDSSPLVTFALLLWLYNGAELTGSSARESLYDVTSPLPQSPTLDVERQTERQRGPFLSSTLWPGPGSEAKWRPGSNAKWQILRPPGCDNRRESNFNFVRALGWGESVVCSTAVSHASLCSADKKKSHLMKLSVHNDTVKKTIPFTSLLKKSLTDFWQTIFSMASRKCLSFNLVRLKKFLCFVSLSVFFFNIVAWKRRRCRDRH